MPERWLSGESDALLSLTSPSRSMVAVLTRRGIRSHKAPWRVVGHATRVAKRGWRRSRAYRLAGGRAEPLSSPGLSEATKACIDLPALFEKLQRVDPRGFVSAELRGVSAASRLRHGRAAGFSQPVYERTNAMRAVVRPSR